MAAVINGDFFYRPEGSDVHKLEHVTFDLSELAVNANGTKDLAKVRELLMPLKEALDKLYSDNPFQR